MISEVLNPFSVKPGPGICFRFLTLCFGFIILLSSRAEEVGILRTKDGYAVPQPNPHFRFPRDHGSHPDYRIEWWYVTGHLHDETSARYGFQSTFFRVASRNGKTFDTLPDQREGSPILKVNPLFQGNPVYMAHMAFVDIENGRYLSEQRFNRKGWDAYSETGRLKMRNGNWSLVGADPAVEQSGELMYLKGSVLGEVSFQLKMNPMKSKVLFGENGLSRKGADPTACSYYITFPRLALEGSLKYRGRSLKVNGLGWMDHEISSSQLTEEQVGWDWAGIQLNDGREIMFYIMRTKSGNADPFSSLTWVNEDGELVEVPIGKFSLSHRRIWESPETGGKYPLDLVLKILDPNLARQIELHLKPLVDNQEMTSRSGSIHYWEGACDVLDSVGVSIGSAYVELTGYSDDSLNLILR
jgi:predicted secreted hydrolase